MKNFLLLCLFLLPNSFCLALNEAPPYLASYQKIFGDDALLMFNEHQEHPQFIDTDLTTEIRLWEGRFRAQNSDNAHELNELYRAREQIIEYWHQRGTGLR